MSDAAVASTQTIHSAASSEQRQIVIDTETTGIDFATDRIVEIGAVELDGLTPTGRTYHAYHNPGIPVPAEATAIHGLTNEFLAGFPAFQPEPLLAFIGDAPLVAHNAGFDIGMLNAELRRCRCPALANPVVDTLAMARIKHPGASCNMDALCKRYGVSTARRTKHGALLDAELLAAVYYALAAEQQTLDLVASEHSIPYIMVVGRQTPLVGRVTEAEMAAHAAFVAELEAASGRRLWA